LELINTTWTFSFNLLLNIKNEAVFLFFSRLTDLSLQAANPHQFDSLFVRKR
jgi:hypothetical protein